MGGLIIQVHAIIKPIYKNTQLVVELGCKPKLKPPHLAVWEVPLGFTRDMGIYHQAVLPT